MTESSRPAVRPTLRLMLSHPAHMLSFGLGSGLAPFAPGTFGSVLGLLLGYRLQPLLGDTMFLALIAAAFVLGIGAVAFTGRTLGVSDHGAIVWDEVVAMALVAGLLPQSLWAQLAGFVLFRLFDISKPGPVGWSDRHVHGGLGVMLDDLIAALLALLSFALLWRLWT